MNPFPIFVVLLLGLAGVSSMKAAPVLSLGNSIFALNGPWRFHSGDDPRWASESADDSGWETVDLTPLPGAHDGDVGLQNYVPGWSALGHRGYVGYAWYRMPLRVTDPGSKTLWLAGPADVDNVYQVFLNGHLLGGIGDFSHDPPYVFSIQPRRFALPRWMWTIDGRLLRGVLAVRVDLVPGASATPAAERGGIHIAPFLGDEESIADQYRLEWLQTAEGYAVDAVEPLLFLMLAVMAITLRPFDRRDRLYPWLTVALVLLAAARANQPIYFLCQFETMREFVLWRLTILDALVLGTWSMVWYEGFNLRRDPWVPKVAVVLTGLYVVARLSSASIFTLGFSQIIIGVSTAALKGIRLAFLVLFLYSGWRGAKEAARGKWLGVAALALVGLGLFGQELNAVGVLGIWFPFGVGVSLSEYVYAAADVVLFLYLLNRLRMYAHGGDHTRVRQ